MSQKFKKYPLNYNPILEYWEKIESGEEVVSEKVRTVYKKLAWDVEHPGEYFYSNKRANHIIEFAENFCRNSKNINDIIANLTQKSQPCE